MAKPCVCSLSASVTAVPMHVSSSPLRLAVLSHSAQPLTQRCVDVAACDTPQQEYPTRTLQMSRIASSIPALPIRWLFGIYSLLQAAPLPHSPTGAMQDS